MTPRMFSMFCRNPRQFNAAGGVDAPHPAVDKLSVLVRVLMFYGIDGVNKRFVVEEPPINPTTNRPYGEDTKKYAAWVDGLGVPPERIACRADIAAAREIVNLIEESQAWPPSAYNTADLATALGIGPDSAPTILAAQDAAVKTVYRDLPLVGYCDWVVAPASGGPERYPAYLLIVNDVQRPGPELAARRKTYEAAFTSFCLNDGKSIRQAIFLLVELQPIPRGGVYLAQIEFERQSGTPLDLGRILDSYLEQKASGKWLTNFETWRPLILTT
jgi:hypothetical protein